MDSIKNAGKERLMKEATEKIKEKAGCFGCFLGCLGPKGFMKVFGCCCLDKETADQVNGLLDRMD
eukprot:CAMPEP_0172439904 /NCGR_PEP_ID=MMETSP1065-20121228/743_1 /TAXON_ID=265537 /ORGANISM="Amphiprora paludosa, Strain CCMP125" /LENGTH=64 /DNA_ID=CAMNT_0013188663 /DNA_START=59 /DNA_END=253 /DNA_ORIENTATION=+